MAFSYCGGDCVGGLGRGIEGDCIALWMLGYRLRLFGGCDGDSIDGYNS